MSASRLDRALPMLVWLRRVDRASLRADALAGLVGAIVVLPQGVAFATLAGMPPEYGLYAAMVPAMIGALFGSSFHLVSGPTNALSILLFAQLAPIAEPGSAQYVQLALTVAFLTGVFQLVLGLAGMGALVRFVSHSVIVGFTAAAGLLIIASQLRNFFGLDLPRGDSFLGVVAAFARELLAGHVNPAVLATGLATLAVALAVRRWLPRLPYMVIAVIAGSLFAAALQAFWPTSLPAIATVGALPGALPPLSTPTLSFETLRVVAPLALGMTILGLTEALSIARAIAAKSGQRIDASQEFVGQGLANITGAFFSAYPASGSFNRSGANFEAGARTPLAAVFASLVLILLLLVLAPLAAHLPLAAMAALLFVVGWGLIDVHHARVIVRASRGDTLVMAGTFAAGLLVNLEFAIIVGVLVALVAYLHRTARPVVRDVKPDPAEGSYHFSADSGLPDCPQLKMLRINGSLYFAAVDHVAAAFAAVDARTPSQKHLLVVAGGINFVDVAGADLLAQEARRRRELGGGLYLYRVKDEARALLERGGHARTIGPENMFAVRTPVIAGIYRRLDVGTCRDCTRRIFRECRTHLPDGTVRPPD